MANAKTGLNYFTIDTDRYQDRRIKRLKKDFGCQGMAVYDYILCEVYRVQGCFLEWDENTAFDVAEYFGLKESLVSEIVKYCGFVGLFDKELLSGGIITSASIQRRYLNMCNRAKRSGIKIPEECRIIREESPIIREECAKTPEVCLQSKVKERKVNKNTLSVSPSFESGDTAESMSAEPTEAERESFFKIFFFKNFKNPSEQVERFVNHYQANGWARNGGIKVVDRMALARSWEPKDEAQKNRFPYLFMLFWRNLHETLTKNGIAPEELNLMLYDIRTVKEASEIKVAATPRLHKLLHEHIEVVNELLSRYYPNQIMRVYETR